MADSFKILSSRRAYIFGADDLKLTMLSIPFVVDQIREAFTFQVAGMGSPVPTFGPVPTTFPPGLAFNAGAWVGEGGPITPIRLLHFEAQRLVVDVAGPSSVIAPIFDRILTIAGQFEQSSGVPIIGEPQEILDYSEVSAHFSFDLEGLFTDVARAHMGQVLSTEGPEAGTDLIIAPTVQIHMRPRGQAYQGTSNADPTLLQLAIRAGTRPRDRIYLSSAPVNSDTNIRTLEELDTSMLLHRTVG